MQKVLVWSRGEHSSKTFSISYKLNSKNSVSTHVFKRYLSNAKNTCADNSRVKSTILYMEKISFFFINLSLTTFMSNPSLRWRCSFRPFQSYFVLSFAPYHSENESVFWNCLLSVD